MLWLRSFLLFSICPILPDEGGRGRQFIGQRTPAVRGARDEQTQSEKAFAGNGRMYLAYINSGAVYYVISTVVRIVGEVEKSRLRVKRRIILNRDLSARSFQSLGRDDSGGVGACVRAR